MSGTSPGAVTPHLDFGLAGSCLPDQRGSYRRDEGHNPAVPAFRRIRLPRRPRRPYERRVRVLGLESSCDELACAILDHDGRTLLANTLHSQVDLHAQFGGVVPEVAARDHVVHLTMVFESALKTAGLRLSDLDGLAVTQGPGLVGPLLCGLEFVKGLAVATDTPLLGVHHLEGHIAAAFLEATPPEPPFVALIVSGGHTTLYRVEAEGGPYRALGSTLDDAAGEAFDKTAKKLGLGYPGGVAIDRLAADGDPSRFAFPDMMPKRPDFSFSGLKTAALRAIEKHGGTPEGRDLHDFCASYQEAIVQNLLKKSFAAVEREGLTTLALVGGVAANRRLRALATSTGDERGIQVRLPSRTFCTDNGAMIARAGWHRLTHGHRSAPDLSPRMRWPLSELPTTQGEGL